MFFIKQNCSKACAWCMVEFTPVNPRRLCCTDACTKKRDDRKHYVKHKDRIYAQTRAYKNKNRAQHLAYLKAYRQLECNKVRIAQQKKKWETKNVPAKRKATADYRAKKSFRTPRWLTQEQKLQILAVYTEAQRLQKLTGVKYCVDHIVPLRGQNVSGLHVPWNLQVIPFLENCKKSNKYV